MEIVDEIKNGVYYLKNLSLKNNTLKESNYWIVRLNDLNGIAIELPYSIEINEEFSSIKYYSSNSFNIHGISRNLLFLVSDNLKHFQDFAVICENFIKKFNTDAGYKDIVSNPINWWNTMKELYGDTNSKKESYSLLAELLTYYYLICNDKSISWVGPLGGSIDFICNDGRYEVKSTTLRHESKVTINSQYQMKADYLMFFRLEKDINGISINSAVNQLIQMNVDEIELERNLSKLGFYKGRSIRDIFYRLLEVKKYIVTEDFPKIVAESFKDDKLPQNISEIVYKVNLEGLTSEAINLNSFSLGI